MAGSKPSLTRDPLRILLGSFLGLSSWCLGTSLLKAADLAHSGRLTDQSGQPLEGPVSLKIRFYREESGSAALGPPLEFPATVLNDGVYQLMFSLSSTQISDIFGRGDILPVYLEVEVNGSVMSRQRYLPTPFALRVPVDNSTLVFNADGKLQVDMISESQVSGLTAKLNSLSDPPTARTNLGLGSLATSSMVTSSQVSNGAISNVHLSAAAGIQDSKLATIVTPGKVSGDAITSGVISGTTGLDISGPVSVANILNLKPAGSSPAEIRLQGSVPTNYISLKAPASLGSALTWTLPGSAGSPNQVLSTDGSGVLSWTSPAGAGTVTSVGITSSGSGLSVSGSPVTGSGSISLSLSDDLAALEGLTTSGFAERTGASTWSTFPVTTAGKSILDDADASAQRTTLGLGALSTAASVSGGSGGTIADGTITNEDISATAAIDQGKILGLSSALSGKEPTVASGTTSQYYRGDKTWQTLTTTAVGEGSNQYFTQARARGALGVSGVPLSYDSGTGVLTIAQASGSGSGYLSASDFLVFNGKQGAITSSSVINSGTLTTALQNGVELKPYGTTAGETGELRFDERAANGTNYVGFRAPDSLATDKIWTLPSGDGSAGQVLSTSGSGVLGWSSLPSGTVSSVGITAPAAGLTVTGSPVTGAGSMTLALSDDLAAVESLSGTGGVERTGVNTWSTYDLSAAGKALIDDADAAAQRTTLGLGALATVSAVSGGTGGTITDATITDADIATSAAIADSKLATISTSGKVANSATTAASGNSLGAIVARDSSGNFSAGTITATTFSSPDSSGTSERFGSGSTAAGLSSLAVGRNATASATYSTALGVGAQGTGSWYGTAVGYNATASGPNGTAIGGAATASGSYSSSLGQGAASTQNYGIAIGMMAQSTGGSSIAIGGGFTTASSANASGGNAVAIGANAKATATNAIALGADSVAGTANTMVVGGSTKAITTATFGNGASDGTPSGFKLTTTSGSGTDITGGSLTLAAGNGTGTGGSGSIIFQTAPAGTTGSTANTLANTMVITSAGNVGIGTTAPSSLFAVGSSSQFLVNSTGNLAKVNNIAYSWPSTQGSASTILTNDGNGNLSWSTVSAGGGGSLTFESKSANYTITMADKGKYFIVTGTITTLTLPTAATAGSGFSVTVKGQGGWAVIARSGTDILEGDTTPIALPTQSVVQLGTDGTNWYVIYGLGVSYRGTPVACASNNCYTTSAAMTAGLAYTATLGKALVLENGVWVQANGTNVLNVDGTDTWHLGLSANGRTQGATNLNKTLAKLGGRVCPTTVYVSDSNKTATGRCLYYDQGSAAQSLGPATEQTSSFTLGDWNTAVTGGGTSAANWYEGNIKLCADKGMRLPVLYETTASSVTSGVPADPASPTFSASTGVPSYGGYTWTSSAYSGASNYYWLWTGTSTSNYNYSYTYAVRCVVP